MHTMHTRTTNTLLAGLAQEMGERWRRGERPTVEEFLERDPSLQQRDASLELIYEEFCLRAQHGPAATTAEYLERFPQYREALEILLGCHALLEPSAQPAAAAPAVGEALGPFHLIAELGRGGLGRVFLARQAALGDRPVVLKVTPRTGREHLALARLQHTHIVPLYAAHDDAARNLRVLCMPYFGNATLARILEALQGRPLERRSGRNIVAIVDELQADTPVPLPARGPAREVLVQSSYVEAICRIGVCLADALQYAHERGLVHLDLKPSNVLIAVDGQPMLLDFHLAQPPLASGQPAPAWLGGTQAYMPPEQEAALDAASIGQVIPRAVDGRADLYALGVLLYEALAGELPHSPQPRPLRKINAQVSRGLSDIIHKCLVPRSELRYADGASLAADLHRHLSDRPLEGVPNRSLSERWRKWRRRRPHRLALASMFVAVVAAAGSVGVNLWDRWTTKLDQANTELGDGLTHLERRRFAEATDSFRRGLALVESQPLDSDLVLKFRARLSQTWTARQEDTRARAAVEFHRLADALRFLHGVDWKITPAAHALADRCALLWDKRANFLGQVGPSTKGDLLDVVLLWADLRVRLASAADQEASRRAALAVLGDAEALLGSSHVLYRQIELLAASLGLKDQADAARRKAAASGPQTAWEHYVLGRQLLLSATGPDAAAKLAAAATALEEALRLQPHGLWPNYCYGQCAYRAGRYEDAIRSFSVSIGAAPEAAELFACRALAHAALGQAAPALRDHAHACKLAPAAAGPRAAIHYNLAVAQAAKGNHLTAREHLDQALRDDPKDTAARALLKNLQAAP
jgi:serine/threonine protein kinase